MQSDVSGPRNESIVQHDWKLDRKQWCAIANVVLGMWLLAGMSVDDGRNTWMIIADASAAFVIIVASLFTARYSFSWPSWLVGIAGVWLLYSPLCFWAGTSGAYAQDSLIGTAVIVCAFVIPGFPGIRREYERGQEIPPKWSYNPSSWSQRIPLLGLAFSGFFIAHYLAAFQLDHIDNVWDPFFGDGTARILTSDVSRAFPVSDAGLGAFSYIIDALAGAMGSTRRWHTMPWLVILFGILVIPPGVTSIVLVMLQPIAVHAWCSLCLLASVVMLIMAPMAADEVIATIQFLQRSKRAGRSFWRTLWFGDYEDLDQPIPAEGMAATVPLTLFFSALAGIWLMCAPTILHTTGNVSNAYYIAGALIVTFAVIAFAEVCRSARLLNIAIGSSLIVLTLFFWPHNNVAVINSVVSGLAICLLSIPRGRILQRYGGWETKII